MAIILVAKTGNWSDPATWIGGVVPAPGDVAVANSYGVTFDTHITVAELRRDTTGGATAGGFFRFNSSVANNLIVTADVYTSNDGAAGQTVVVSPNTVGTINGTVYGNDYGPGSTNIVAGMYGASVSTNNALLYVRATVQGSRGMPAVFGPMQFIDAAHASAKVRATSGLTEITLRAVDAVVPVPSDVKAGVSYAGKTGTAVATPPFTDMRNP